MWERETIIHNTGDEPILVEQADGSQMIVRPGEKRQARLLNRGDFANAAPSIAVAKRDAGCEGGNGSKKASAAQS